MEFIQIFVGSIFLTAAYIDWKSGNIPDQLTLSFVIVGIILSLFRWMPEPFIMAFLIYILGGYLFQKQIGGGDVKLLMGLQLVQPTWNGHPLALNVFFLGLIICFLFMVLPNKLLKGKDSVVRFGPFLFLGLLLSYLGLTIFQ